MSTPTDGEWMSAKEALDCLGLGFANGAHAICGFAFAGLVQAKARRFLVEALPPMMTLSFPVSSGRGAKKRRGTIGGQDTSRQRLMTGASSKHLVSNSVVQTSSD
jgi:hypothetical protein